MQIIKIKNTRLIISIITLMIFLLVATFAFSGNIYAETTSEATNSTNSLVEGAPTEEETFDYECSSGQNSTAEECLKNNPIVKWLNVLINVFAGIIGIGAVVMIIVAGIQYMSARDNPQAVQSAKEKITSVVIGLVAFGLLYAFVNWLIPGGVI